MALGEYVRKVMKEKHLSAMKVQKNSGRAISDTYVLKIRSGKVKAPLVVPAEGPRKRTKGTGREGLGIRRRRG